MSNDDYQGILEQGRFHEMGLASYERNYYKAYKRYKVTPEFKRGEPYHRIGELLMVGDDFLPKNYKKSRSNFEIAAVCGHREARYALGQMYKQGRGVDVDNARAKLYCHQALDVGYTEAARDIGMMSLRAPPGVRYQLFSAKIYLEGSNGHCGTDADVHVALGITTDWRNVWVISIKQLTITRRPLR